MSGDYSRKTFDPLRDFSGVLMQQGRVQLDADWNELVGIISRRLRAETTDIIGRGTVPKETPDGFKIEISGGTLTIGRGRIYVDGLLAENHGKPPLEFDAVLGEQRGALAIPYDEQPYFPNAATVAPAPTEGGPYLVYLDVWQREVTYLELDDLIEKAVGVDTTTRLQTVWQVRVLADIGQNVACDTSIQAWDHLIKSSDGRLSTDAVGVASVDDPCVIPPSGGYRGLENRLYRVEIHDGGAAGVGGTATFKWSRDNASIATSVTAIPALDKLIVARVGRDNTLRFGVGDWIEITDDWLEFAQKPGLMCQIKDVVDATLTITLTNPLPAGTTNPPPAGTFPTDAQGNTDPTRHTRIKLWNQSGKVTDTNGNLLVDLNAPGSTHPGVIPVPPSGTSIILEDGVQVTFDTPTTGIYCVGDYWCFAARTADASVEELVEAPPRGIHHHFCRLAIVTFSNPPPTDCRVLWPPTTTTSTGGCCTVTVRPQDISGGDTLQSIIDQFSSQDRVTICLLPGMYALPAPLVLTRQHSNLTLQGCHEGVFLTAVAGAEANFVDGMVVLSQTSRVTLSNLAFILPVVPFLTAGGQLAGLSPDALAQAGGPAVPTMNRLNVSIGIRPVASSNLTIRKCEFQLPGVDPSNADANTFAVGVFAGNLCSGLTLEGNTFVRESTEPVEISTEPFRVSIGFLLAPESNIQTIQATQRMGRKKPGKSNRVAQTSAVLSGSVVPPAILEAHIRGNSFIALTAAMLSFAGAGGVNVDDNTAQVCYSGFWIFGRRTQPDTSIGTSDTDGQVLQDILLDPVLVVGSAIARSYPVPKASGITGTPVSNVNLKLVNPFPNNALLAQFDVLLQFVAAMEAAAAAQTVGSLSLHCANNRVDALWTTGPQGDSGEALVVWGEDGDFESDVVLTANKLRNYASPVLSTAVIVSMSRCVINGNVILNVYDKTPGWCLYVILTTGQSALQAGMAVTGNVLQTATNPLPNNMNAFV